MPASTSAGGQTGTPPGSPSSPSFEEALADLERIAQAMEGGNLSLEESLSAYKRGVELLKLCQGQLADAEQRVQVLESGTLKDLNSPEA
ncbi:MULTISPECIES: exodeoxyribonuclease VII small subunit [Azospira]|uniref:Exodeoxyribonuclease 7 small subunit n=2 Tax=Azospira oryzae TaxID=146939 RepID=G8QLC3_AZOOP|nr:MULTISPECIES: exodeoxyribonuclease VII small subunit [Azospira]TLS18427.1 MAG: exodeoxyribonuclease VII small subunit [Betaproteobacteria bacterium]AEV27837.1 exodeoxyribonuclease VII, small subunit [Azospira oryzae PS]MBP7488650.1 exodeoxyribonuclease VII small subunit [Azospira sp.]MDK9689741.1 exodeoxyribonuclease VII small subunit [Azospira sp.]RZT90699.1 exodeoxyribonuclease VII small subunit [Azospira oryzae]